MFFILTEPRSNSSGRKGAKICCTSWVQILIRKNLANSKFLRSSFSTCSIQYLGYGLKHDAFGILVLHYSGNSESFCALAE